MTRRNYRRVSGILTDHCERCGTWVDQASLVRILVLIADGRIPELDRLATERAQEDTLRQIELDAQRGLAVDASLRVKQATFTTDEVVHRRSETVAHSIADLLTSLFL